MAKRNILGMIVDSIPRNRLNERSVPYWRQTRSEMVGAPVDEFEAQNKEACIEENGRMFNKVGSILEELEGPFFEGKNASYVDFVWASVLLFFKNIDENLYQELIQRSGKAETHQRLLDSCEPWIRRDSE